MPLGRQDPVSLKAQAALAECYSQPDGGRGGELLCLLFTLEEPHSHTQSQTPYVPGVQVAVPPTTKLAASVPRQSS